MSSRSDASKSKPATKPLRRVLLWALPVVALAIAWQVLSGPRGLLKISDLRSQKQQLLSEIDSLETRKRELLVEKTRLLTDTAYLEKLARKELGMAKPGEKVYRFVNPEASSNPSSESNSEPTAGRE